jgi:hypothetical protein
MGTAQGIYPWVNTLVMGNVMERRFWVERGCFCFWGGEETELQGEHYWDVFRRTTRVPNSPGCMLYIICWAVGVSLEYVFRSSRRGSSILDCPGQTRALLKLRQPVDLVHALKTVKGLLLIVPPRTPRNSGYDVYAHAVYVVIRYVCICYMSVICLVLGPSSGSIGSVWIYRRDIFGKQNWWCARTSCTLIYIGAWAHKYMGHETANWGGS